VKTGTTSVTIKFAVTDVDGAAVTAGRPVVVTLGTASGDTFKINGKSTSDTVYTDASGTATVTVTALAGNVNAAVTATAVAEGVASAAVVLGWADATVGIADLSGTGAVDTSATLAVTRTIKKGGSYTLSLGAQDQFNTVADSAAYRFLVTGNGVSEAVKPLVAGKASVTITDTLGTALTTTIALQKLTGATWAAVNTWTVTTNLVTTPALSLGAKGVTTYGTAVVTSAPVATATTSLDAVDGRSSSLINPSFGANYVVLNGAAQNSATSVGVVGQIVTVSGPASVLFSNGSVSAKGSLSFVSGASGLFEVKAYSQSAQTDSVITFTSEGVSKTIKVSFTGVSVGKTNVLSAAAGATTTQAGRAVDYTATVVDAQGNPVSGFALKATLTGAGYFAGSVNSSGAVETTTDINGKAVVKVLFSAQDAGTATVTFADNDASTATADNLKSIVLATEIGATDANIDIVANRVTAVASFSKGKTVAFYVDGVKKWSKTSASDADVVLNYNLKKGTHTVTVKISGGFVTTEKFIVK
jgi:adhesin/invasin